MDNIYDTQRKYNIVRYIINTIVLFLSMMMGPLRVGDIGGLSFYIFNFFVRKNFGGPKRLFPKVSFYSLISTRGGYCMKTKLISEVNVVLT